MSMPIPILIAMILIGSIGGIVYTVGLSKKWGIMVPFIGMLLFASMALPLNWRDQINPTVWLPLQQNRSSLFLGCGVLGLIVVLFQTQRLRGKPLALSALTLFFVGLYAAFLRFIHGGAADGAESVVFVVCTMIPLLYASSLVMDSIEDFVIVLQGVLVANALWIGMVFVQIVINHQFVATVREFRFVGLFSSPQHTGVLMAFFCTISLWMLLNGPRKFKLIYIGLLGINTLFLLWTGSRTGLGMTLIGVSSVLYTRTGRAILILPFAGILTYVSFKVLINLMGTDLGFSRLASTANTREVAWKTMLDIGLSNPMIGVGTMDAVNSENSYLYGFASYGIGMLGILGLFTFMAFIEGLKNLKARFSLPSHLRPHLDLVSGIMAMYFAGAILEGYIITRVSASLCFITLFMGAGAFIRKFAYSPQSEYEYEDQYNAYEDHTEYIGYGDLNDNGDQY